MRNKHFASEAELHKAMEGWFDSLEIPYASQVRTPNFSAVDIVLLHGKDADIWGVIEVKNGLDVKTTSVADLAEYFEQCVKYRISTGKPVFLGPFFIPTMGIATYFGGGASPKYATASFSAYAGRMDVGLLFICAEPGYETDPKFWYGMRMTVRQKTVAEFKTQQLERATWPKEALTMVSLDGCASNKVRT